jgi:hypothetical protein
VTINDYKVETIINHGAGAGQMQYGAVTFGAPADDGVTSQCTVTRNFANASGGAITVNEITMVIQMFTPTQNDSHGQWPYQQNFCILRDVIAGGVAVPNGDTLTVNYRPQAVI